MTQAPDHNPITLPADLPVPIDDGACAHLRFGSPLPHVKLPCTSGETCDVAALAASPRVYFFYPRTGIPGQPPSLGFENETWESIPGARGCTPQSCGFRDLYSQFQMLGVNVLGISTNTIEHQREFKKRQHVPFEFLSDADLRLTKALTLPTFEFPVESGGPTTLLKRMAWYCEQSTIRKIWYPVFPPGDCAQTVLDWIKGQRAISIEPIGPGNIAYLRSELRRNWHSTTIFSRGVRFEADSLPGLIASVGGEPVGHLTFHADKQGLEVITLASNPGNQGVGSALMDRAELEARSRKSRRLFLTTTNDNLNALRFYQRRGMRLVKVHYSMMDRYRDQGQPIPHMGMNGIPLRDELELEINLES
jgi:peroxiredoxin/GNAT superfamily N-acetyltransferase